MEEGLKQSSAVTVGTKTDELNEKINKKSIRLFYEHHMLILPNRLPLLTLLLIKSRGMASLTIREFGCFSRDEHVRIKRWAKIYWSLFAKSQKQMGNKDKNIDRTGDQHVMAVGMMKNVFTISYRCRT